MLNFRKIKQDLSPGVVKKGQVLFDEGGVVDACIKEFGASTLKLEAKVKGTFDKDFKCQVELDKKSSEITFSKCDCPKKYDCEHVVAAINYIEGHLDDLLAHFAKSRQKISSVASASVAQSSVSSALRSTSGTRATAVSGLGSVGNITQKMGEVSKELMEATKRFEEKQNEQFKKELVSEYRQSWSILAHSPFFIRKPDVLPDVAQLYLIIDSDSLTPSENYPGCQALVSVRLPGRVKPIQVQDLVTFFESIEFQEPIVISGQKVLLTRDSFTPKEQSLLDELLKLRISSEGKSSKTAKKITLTPRIMGRIFHVLYNHNSGKHATFQSQVEEEEGDREFLLDPVFLDGLDMPMVAKVQPIGFEMSFEYLDVESPKVMLDVKLYDTLHTWRIDHAILLPNLVPGALIDRKYYPFRQGITRAHLKDALSVRDLIVPEPMFGTLTEHGIRRMRDSARVKEGTALNRLTTMPCLEQPGVEVAIGEDGPLLCAEASFIYEGASIPATPEEIEYDHIQKFLSGKTSVGRDIWFEAEVLHHLFAEFQYEPENKRFTAGSERQVLDFMTRIVPEFRHLVNFKCPASLLARYLYDPTELSMKLSTSDHVHEYIVNLEVDGPLEGVRIDQLKDCVSQSKTYLKIANMRIGGPRRRGSALHQRVVVLDLKKLAPIIELLDDLGLEELTSKEIRCPLWTLAHIDHDRIAEMPINFVMDDALREVEAQLKGESHFEPSPIPTVIQAKLRPYQVQGVEWVEKLRKMYLNGILADDMGLGKTLQTICALTQYSQLNPKAQHMIVCPTSLVYNWKEEVARFSPQLGCTVIDGAPVKRHKILQGRRKPGVLVTSYSLLQKDIELYEEIDFDYVILDEAQYIKNRNTRNARCCKRLGGKHKLLLTGTPVENSLEELWSLFDFLMPGFLGSFDGFCNKYTRQVAQRVGRSARQQPAIDLKTRIQPFITRRMKQDVLDDLPPVNEVVYHCHLTDHQKELYQRFASDARKELSALVEKEGFEKVQIHILATLTRLKQICCHPAIFAKEESSLHDSAKYDLFLNMVDNLMESGNKAVVFSQYTRMLSIMRHDLQSRGIRFSYLDGTSKDRLEIVKEFNSDKSIPIFLVSLKAGGSGLNLVGADTVIHYDMWWNPAVESQATDRVHRIGQTQKVSSYKLVTLGTIEEKIVQMQSRKKALVKKVISSDDDMLSKLTWDEVLELLATD